MNNFNYLIRKKYVFELYFKKLKYHKIFLNFEIIIKKNYFNCQ